MQNSELKTGLTYQQYRSGLLLMVLLGVAMGLGNTDGVFSFVCLFLVIGTFAYLYQNKFFMCACHSFRDIKEPLKKYVLGAYASAFIANFYFINIIYWFIKEGGFGIAATGIPIFIGAIYFYYKNYHSVASIKHHFNNPKILNATEKD